MTKITTKATAKVAAVATALGMATSLLSLAPMAHAAALTQTQIDSIITLLESFGADSTTVANVKASLTGGTPTTTGGSTAMSGSCSFTMDLHNGSTGAEVTCLQQALIAAGYSIPAGATGYYGSQTTAAVAAWQAASGVSPAVGYFGPISRAAWNLGGGSTDSTGGNLPAGCTSTSGYSPTTGEACSGGSTSSTLSGTGYFNNESSLGDVTSTLYVGDDATAVVGDSFDATDGDVQLQRVDATFDLSAVTTGSTNLDRYVKDVQIWLGDKKLATMDASDGDKSSNVWTYRFSGLNAVIKEGDVAKIYVKVTPLSSIGNNEDGNGAFAGTMNARLLANAIRAVGGDGISDTYVSTAITQSFTVNSAITGTLTASPASDNPVASSVSVSSSTTTGVKLLAFNLKAKNAGVDITDMKISLNTSDDNLSDVVNTVYLMKGSTILKSSTLSTGSNGTVTFSNVNQSIAKDDTEEYTIVADLKGDVNYADGTTLIASTTTAGWDVSDDNGNSVTPSSAVSGNTMTLTGTGISVVKGDVNTTVNTAAFSGGKDTATFTIGFTVTAGDTAVYIGGGTPTATTSTAGKTSTTFATQLNVVYATTTTSTATSSNPTQVASLAAEDTDSNDSGSNYYIAANDSRKFTLTLSAAMPSASAAGTSITVGYQLVGINYDTSSTMGTTYYSSNLNTYKTDDAILYAH